MRIKLNHRLEEQGCDKSKEQVNELLVDLLAELHPSWSIDELLLHPKHAARFCNLARQKLRATELEDDVLLRVMISSRKRAERPVSALSAQ